MRRLRIGVVIPGFAARRDEPGLPAVLDLIERIAAVHEVEVVALRHPPRRQPFQLVGATVHTVGAGQHAGVSGRSAVLGRGMATLLALHRQRRMDVLHGLWVDEAGALATVAGRLLRRPAVVSLMGGELVALPDIEYGAALGRGGRWTAALALRGARLVSVASDAMRDLVHERLPDKDVRLAPLGVDTQLFRPPDDQARSPVVLFAGSLEPVKDPLLALRAFARIAARHPQARLRFLGDGRLRQAVERAAGELGVGGHVELAGYVDRNGLPAEYRAAALLVISSRHEAQSMVAVEAAASGLPIVGTCVGIVPDLGSGAISVPVGDEAGLAGAMSTLLEDAALRQRHAAAARTAAVERYDIKRTSAALLAIYDEVAAG